METNVHLFEECFRTKTVWQKTQQWTGVTIQIKWDQTGSGQNKKEALEENSEGDHCGYLWCSDLSHLACKESEKVQRQDCTKKRGSITDQKGDNRKNTIT